MTNCDKKKKKVEPPEVIVVEEWRKWAGLNPEILALIFKKVGPVEEMMKRVPLVCKGWMEVVAGPYCWSEVDVQGWCRRRSDSNAVDMVVMKLVRRSKCMVQLLSVYRLGESGFFFVANCGKFLKELQMPMSVITDQMLSKHIKPLPNLTMLDVSYCFKITAKGLAAFGNQCKSLVHLKRNMPPLDASSPVNDSEAKAIADTMPCLEWIELCFGQFGDSGLSEIITKCNSLAKLDIIGSWNVQLNGDLLEKCEYLKDFQSPWSNYDNEYCDTDGSDIDMSGFGSESGSESY
uniref:F-box protein FBW2-like n=1 Tax=Erigeron canadensis TaxID=72917 RepID=UPI001CB9932B|nr:F-box protein FBW2-like [Erigeron canadensis]